MKLAGFDMDTVDLIMTISSLSRGFHSPTNSLRMPYMSASSPRSGCVPPPPAPRSEGGGPLTSGSPRRTLRAGS
eukprot:6593237-Pyramimonas_sp.AAC.1